MQEKYKAKHVYNFRNHNFTFNNFKKIFDVHGAVMIVLLTLVLLVSSFSFKQVGFPTLARFGFQCWRSK